MTPPFTVLRLARLSTANNPLHIKHHYIATGAGTLLGPSSLVNSACSLCSNAKYTCNWNVKTTKRVPAGAQFLTNYAQPGVDLFCREIVPGVGGSSVICGKKIGGSR